MISTSDKKFLLDVLKQLLSKIGNSGETNKLKSKMRTIKRSKPKMSIEESMARNKLVFMSNRVAPTDYGRSKVGMGG